MTEDFEDLKLLGKLSEGDIVATEAKCHSKSFLNLFNCYHKHIHNTTVESNDNQDNFIEGMNKLEAMSSNLYPWEPVNC